MRKIYKKRQRKKSKNRYAKKAPSKDVHDAHTNMKTARYLKASCAIVIKK